jgi:hypothetical protein
MSTLPHTLREEILCDEAKQIQQALNRMALLNNDHRAVIDHALNFIDNNPGENQPRRPPSSCKPMLGAKRPSRSMLVWRLYVGGTCCFGNCNFGNCNHIYGGRPDGSQHIQTP